MTTEEHLAWSKEIADLMVARVQREADGNPGPSDYSAAVAVLIEAADQLMMIAYPGDEKESLRRFRKILAAVVKAADKALGAKRR